MNTSLLCDLAQHYGTDKCPQIWHPYTPVYDALFGQRREAIRTVVEIGIGYYAGIADQPWRDDRRLGRRYHRGASLKMWRDYFPNARVYGVDVRPECLFSDERITTLCLDATDPLAVAWLIDVTGPAVDLWVDDGSHHARDQIATCRAAMPRLDPGVTYVIEDVRHSRALRAGLADYVCESPPLPPHRWHLMIVRHPSVPILTSEARPS